jgi:hypothetical protein
MSHLFETDHLVKTQLNFLFHSSKRELINDIDFIFIECGINLFGYNKQSDTYWGKKVEKHNICKLYFKINFDELNNSFYSNKNTKITISIIHGIEHIAKNFCLQFYEKMSELDE